MVQLLLLPDVFEMIDDKLWYDMIWYERKVVMKKIQRIKQITIYFCKFCPFVIFFIYSFLFSIYIHKKEPFLLHKVI